MLTFAGIAVAGAAGALARYGVDALLSRRSTAFPWGILVVNVTGSLAVGFAYALLTQRFDATAWVRSTAMVGFLGAYTTFSTLSLDTFRLLERGSYVGAVMNSVGSLALGVLAVYLGMSLARQL